VDRLGVDFDHVEVDLVVVAERVVPWVRHLQDFPARDVVAALLLAVRARVVFRYEDLIVFFCRPVR
jgi:hypothetical protein